MNALSHIEIVQILLSIGLMLIIARMFGEFFRQIRMPLIVGELIAGIFFGPSIMGHYFPQISELVFVHAAKPAIAINGITSISVVMLLFVAGMEVDLSLIRQQGKTALKTSFLGLLIPMSAGYFIAYHFYPYFGEHNSNDVIIFSLFIGTAMSITALPVIARTLMDLGLFRSKVGSVIIAAAMMDDLTGWLLFSVVMGMLKDASYHNLLYTLVFTIVFAVIMLTAVRLFINKSLPWASRNFSWPGGFLSISLGIAFLSAAFTEYIGIHAIFGAFIVGIAFGDSVHVTNSTRDIVNQFVTNIFAPLFFVSIGFKVNFIENFDIKLIAIILSLAICSKLTGAWLGARWGGLGKRESLAVGFGMNARGAMEIILATLALQAHLIAEPLYVAIVTMAIITSVIAGPALQFLLKNKSTSTTDLTNG